MLAVVSSPFMLFNLLICFLGLAQEIVQLVSKYSSTKGVQEEIDSKTHDIENTRVVLANCHC